MNKKGLILIGVIFFLGAVCSLVFQDNSGGDFDLGTYVNVTHNGTGVVLSEGNLTGSFTSRVFDAGADAYWNNLTYISSNSNLKFLFAVDGSGDVYKSSDDGVSWTMVKENYGRKSATKDMFTSDGFIFILSSAGNEVWRSDDYGASFSLVNDTLSSSPLQGAADSQNNLYVLAGPGTVFRSTTYGLGWEELDDFNGPSTNKPKGIAVNSSDDVYAVDGLGDVYYSVEGGINWVKVNDGYGGSTATDGMAVDSNDDLYILLNTEIYQSTDDGVSWNVINDSISPYANVLVRLHIDDDDNFYILDAVGRVFVSTDYGFSWSEVGDMNGGASNDPLGISSLVLSTNVSFQVRSCSQSDCSDGNFSSADLSNLSLQGRYFQYRADFESHDVNMTSVLESVGIDYELINVAPVLNLVFPQEGATYGYNESVDLNFSVSDSDGNLDSCWYNIDGDENVSLTDCANATFNVSEGSHVLKIYANDSEGEVANDSVSFSIAVGAPTISLSYPVSVYLDDSNVSFRFTAMDIDLDSCELWGDFNGTFLMNSSVDVVSGVEAEVNLTLGDGSYLWNVWCNDSQGNSAFDGNKTFYVDTVDPQITISQPAGTKTSRTSIPFTFSVVDDSPTTCIYNVYLGDSLSISNRTVNCSSTSFDVSADGNFVLNLYVNDSAGNVVNDSSGFVVDTSSQPPPGDDDDTGGGGGGGGGGGLIVSSGILSLESIDNLILEPGENRRLTLKAKNTGVGFLGKCRVNSEGDYASWISESETKDLTAGEPYDFVFNLNVPQDAEAGTYDFKVILKCDGDSDSVDFSGEVIDKKLNFEIISSERDDGNLKIIYSMTELSGIEQNVDIQFLLMDGDEKVGELSETQVLQANENRNFESFIPIEGDVDGSINLLININSDVYSTFVQENVVLGSPVTGFAIFRSGDLFNNLIIAGILVAFFVFAFFLVRRILYFRKKRNVHRRALFHVFWHKRR